MSFYPSDYRDTHRRVLKALSEEVVPLVGSGTGFTDGEPLHAHVSRVREPDLIPGSSIKLDDMRVIIYVESQAAFDKLPTLTQKDRLRIRGRSYAIVLWDVFTRSVQGETMAVTAVVRG